MVDWMTKEVLDPSAKFWQWVRTIASVIVVPLVIWGVNIEKRVSAIEANRFTAIDALAIYQQLSLKANKEDVPPEHVLKAIELLQTHIQWHLDHSP